MHGQIRISTGSAVSTPMGEGLVVGFTQQKNTDENGVALRGRPINFALVAGLKTNRGTERVKPVPFRLSELSF